MKFWPWRKTADMEPMVIGKQMGQSIQKLTK